MRSIIARRLTNVHVNLAENGKEALELLQEGRYDALVVDAHMPGVSGVETCMRARLLDANMGIALVSAFRALPLSMSGFGGIGVDCVAFKPLGPVRFARIVRHLLQTDPALRGKLRQRGAICVESEMEGGGAPVAEPTTSRWCIQGHRNPRSARFCCDCGMRLTVEGGDEQYTPEFGDASLTQEFDSSLRDPALVALFRAGVARMDETRALYGIGAAGKRTALDASTR